METLKAVDAPHLVTLYGASPMYWRVVLNTDPSKEALRIPFYYLPKVKKFVLVFDVYAYDPLGNIEAKLISADTSEDLQARYLQIIKAGRSKFIQENATFRIS